MMESVHVFMLAVMVSFTVWLIWAMYTKTKHHPVKFEITGIYKRLFSVGGIGALVAMILWEIAVYFRWSDSSSGLRHFMYSWSVFFLPLIGGIGFIVGSFLGLFSRKWNR
jgi:hypothetical protein